MAYTPGPWEVKETKDGMTTRANRRRLEIVAPCPDGGEMVIVGKHTGLDCLQSDNARLISAAPELLEALKEITNFYMNDCKCTLSDGFVCVVHRTKKAIAKAEKMVTP